MRNRMQGTIRGLIMLALLAGAAGAQQVPDNMPQRGVVPAGTYAPTNVDTVDAVNGNVLVNIPLAKLPPGRAGWSAGLNLMYNSGIYDLSSGYVPNPLNNELNVLEQAYAPSTSGGGWQYGYNYQIWMDLRQVAANPSTDPTTAYDYCTSTYQNVYRFRLRVIFPDGSNHTMHMYGYKDGDDYYSWDPAGSAENTGCVGVFPPSELGIQPAPTGSVTYYSIDGTFLNLTFQIQSPTWTNNPFTLTFPDGRTVTGVGATPTAMSDKNGNTITMQNLIGCPGGVCTSPTTVLSDAFGRNITLQSNLNGQFLQDVITQTWYQPSAADPAPGNTGTLTWTVNWETVTLTTPHVYDCYYQFDGQSQFTCDANGTTVGAIQSIVVPQPPDGSTQQYLFNYGCAGGGTQSGTCNTTGWGQMSDITFPSQATVHYDYTPFGAQGSMALLTSWVTDKTESWNDEDDSPPTPRQDKWLYQFSFSNSVITNPDGGQTTTNFYSTSPQNSPGYVIGGLTYQIIYPDQSMTQKVWTENAPYDPGTAGSVRNSILNPYVQTEFDTRPNGTQTKAQVYTYDQNGNVVCLSEYDYFATNQVVQSNGVATAFSGPTSVRQTSNAYIYATANAVSLPGSANDIPTAYWRPSAPAPRNLLLHSAVTGAGPGAVTEFVYDNHGNPTQKLLWDSSVASSQPTGVGSLNSGNALVLKTIYDTYGYGNVTDVQDAKSNDTHYDYDGNNLYLIDQIQAYQTPLAETTTYSFDSKTGVMNQTTDPNGLTTAFGYDRYARLVTSAQTTSSGLQRLTTNSYEDGNRRIVVSADLNTAADQALQSVTDYDQLGRVRLTRQLECSVAVATLLNCAAQSVDDDTTGIKVQTRYQTVKANGYSYQLVSNPFRAGTTAAPPPSSTEPTMGWTLTTSDQMGRAVRMENFSGPTMPQPWSGNSASSGAGITTYNQDNTVVVQDEAGNARKNTTDGLGRLIQVQEDPNNLNYSTTYTYDALDDLTSVAQGSLPRTFTYDSMKRLIQAVNPESGTIQYSYRTSGSLCAGDSSSLCSRTDAASITTTMAYDALNRVTTKSFSDNVTSTVSYCYDAPPGSQGCPGTVQAGFVGRLTQVQNANSSTTYAAYDALGRVASSIQQPTGGSSYAFTYTYNPLGGVVTMQYPSTGRVVNYAYDGAGRALSVQENNLAQTVYASGIQYAPQGAPVSMTFGNQLAETRQYNNLLQTTQIQAGSNLTLAYTYSSNQNNGNLLSQQIQAGNLNVTQNYGYDTLNRLSTAAEGSNWQQSYVYDPYGNRAVLAGASPVYIPGNTQTPQVSTNSVAAVESLFPSNRYTGCTYDNSNPNGPGNTTSCLGLAAGTLVYDAENHMVSAGSTAYLYDGAGNRVSRTTGGVTTLYLYGADGTLASEYSTVPSVGATQYLTADVLGSTRLVTSASGCSRHDFLPFGEEIDPSIANRAQQDPCYSNGATDGVTQKFTGIERDSETGTDNFLARHFASAQGRFMSPDPLGSDVSDPTNPQSWNLYSYVWNTPMVAVDPDGTNTCYIDGVQTDCALAQMSLANGSAAVCPNNTCSYATAGGFYQFQFLNGGGSGYVRMGSLSFDQETFLRTDGTHIGKVPDDSGLGLMQNLLNLDTCIENNAKNYSAGGVLNLVFNKQIPGSGLAGNTVTDTALFLAGRDSLLSSAWQASKFGYGLKAGPIMTNGPNSLTTLNAVEGTPQKILGKATNYQTYVLGKNVSKGVTFGKKFVKAAGAAKGVADLGLSGALVVNCMLGQVH